MIIDSLLDTDLYKFTMMQVVLHQFPGAQVEYKFKCRNPETTSATGVTLASLIDEIRAEVDHLCTLRFTEDELAYLRGLRFIKSDFVDFLALFKLNPRTITIEPVAGNAHGEIDIRITGPWLHTILFEVPVLAIVNEVYFRHVGGGLDEGRARLASKVQRLKAPQWSAVKIADYGTRRRFGRAWQEEVVRTLAQDLGTGPSGQFAGTSNVDLARRLNLTPLGTMAHEYLQAAQALGPRLRDSQVFAFESWAKEYRGDLGIALSDVYGMTAFLRDFDMFFCKLFDGARHDSGDPFTWGERMIAHYAANRCDPRTKTLIFSDSLTIDRTLELYERFAGRAQLAFGIGTHLTNDVGPAAGQAAHVPLQIVIKMVRCNGQPVAKLSDSPGKGMCDDEAYLAYLRQVFEIAPPAADTAHNKT